MGQMKFSYRRPDWRSYQNRLRKNRMQKKGNLKIGFYSLFITFLAFAVYGISGKSVDSAASDSRSRKVPLLSSLPASPVSGSGKHPSPTNTSPGISKSDVRTLLDRDIFFNIREDRFHYNSDGHRFLVDTSIDSALQNFILDSMDRKNSRYIGIVAMDPVTGRVLSMAGYDSSNSGKNTCTDALFPAASIFKIITAAAAVEECGFRSDSTLVFRGRKHTLYKSQLKKQSGGMPITLLDSFAQSVNPVFGKLGIHFLGKSGLESRAEAFGFKRPINFELPVERSTIWLSDDDYQLAEIASGFNRTTAISPLHGALMVSAIVANQGKMIEPGIVDRLRNEKGELLYSGRPRFGQQAIRPETSLVVKKMMEETILTGTCRKTFKGFEKHPVLSRLNMGGKTGTIGSRNHENRRYDWFVGFAEEKEGDGKIVLSVVVTHEKHIGIKANKYARMIMEEYFRRSFSGQSAKGSHNDSGTEKSEKST